jgi:hypothetical protein
MFICSVSPVNAVRAATPSWYNIHHQIKNGVQAGREGPGVSSWSASSHGKDHKSFPHPIAPFVQLTQESETGNK